MKYEIWKPGMEVTGEVVCDKNFFNNRVLTIFGNDGKFYILWQNSIVNLQIADIKEGDLVHVEYKGRGPDYINMFKITRLSREEEAINEIQYK